MPKPKPTSKATLTGPETVKAGMAFTLRGTGYPMQQTWVLIENSGARIWTPATTSADGSIFLDYRIYEPLGVSKFTAEQNGVALATTTVTVVA